MIRYDMIWYDKLWYDMINYGMIWNNMINYDMMWHDIWYDMINYDMIWYDTIWFDTQIFHLFYLTLFAYQLTCRLQTASGTKWMMKMSLRYQHSMYRSNKRTYSFTLKFILSNRTLIKILKKILENVLWRNRQ